MRAHRACQSAKALVEFVHSNDVTLYDCVGGRAVEGMIQGGEHTLKQSWVFVHLLYNKSTNQKKKNAAVA